LIQYKIIQNDLADKNRDNQSMVI